MSKLLYTETRVIGGRTYTISPLDVATGRKVYARVQRYLGIFASDAKLETGASPLMLASMGTDLAAEDIEYLCSALGQTTQVDMGDGRSLSLKDSTTQNELFAGTYEDQYEWLDACLEVNFRGVIEKMKGVLRKADATAAKSKA